MVFKRLFIFIFCFTVFNFVNITKVKAEGEFFKKTQYCRDNNLGWKFYCDEELEKKKAEEKQKKKDKEKTKTQKETSEDKKEKSYSEMLADLQKQVEEAKAKAVLEPTEDNIKSYMFIQQKLVNQASYFSDVWRRIIWTTPELDYTQKRPVSNVGKNVWQSNRQDSMENTLRNINKRYGIFFIYSSTCGFCQKYSEILYDLKQRYNLEIKGISIDGNFLPLWENNSFANKGQLEKMGIDYRKVPITVLFDNLNKTVIPVGYGLMAQDEIMQRIYVLTQKKVGEDY